MAKQATAEERRHMGRVASLPCCACGAEGVHVHHIREERIKDNFLTIPLCPGCHLGAFSIHKSKRSFEGIYGSELHLLAQTIGKLSK
ncbi:MAG: hypothetical protein WAW61_22410 [Methylococcaceae bacterium]